MSKIIKYENEAKEAIIKGIDAVANIVKTTVGPRGRNVLIRNQVSAPIITNDGVTIAKAIEFKDTAEDAGAQLIISAANKTNEIAGDGTTTTTILAQEIIHQYYQYEKDHPEINPVQVQKEMIQASNLISDFIKSEAQPIQDTASLQKVATISSGSSDIGELIANAFNQAGEFGSVIVEDSKTGTDNLVSIQGMKLSNGSVTPYLLNDRINMKSDMLDVNVLITKDKIDSVTDLFKVLDICINQGRKLLIICDDIEFEPLNMILMNKAKGIPLNIAVIRLPGFGELRENLVEDICLATGATLFGRDIGRTLKDFDPKFLGELDQLIVTSDESILKFKDQNSNEEDLLQLRYERVAELEANKQKQPKEALNSIERRISNLISGISVIQVGGNSELEIKDKKLRIEDAINSVKAAKEEGIVAGGGYSFIEAKMHQQGQDLSIGNKIVNNALTKVTFQIAENSGLKGQTIVDACIANGKGYNALTNKFENLVETGVINSAKVDRYSLINATSIAATVITMGGLIVEENEKDPNILQLQTPMTLA